MSNVVIASNEADASAASAVQVSAEVHAIGPIFRKFAASSFVYLGGVVLLGLLLLSSDSFMEYTERTQWVTLHWNLGFSG